MKDTAKTGFMTNATNKDAPSVMIKVTGRLLMNLPMIPGQKSKGTKGMRVVSVPASTGQNTSPAAAFAARTMEISEYLL